MQIAFERSGGFAGMRIPKVIDTANLPAPEVNQLRMLLEASNFFHLPANITSPTPQPDRFQYKITVEDGDKHHTVVVSEQAVPGSLRPLLDWLMAAARSR